MSRRLLPGAPVVLASVTLTCLALADTKSPPDVPTVIISASPLTDDPDGIATTVDSVDRDQILRSGDPGVPVDAPSTQRVEVVRGPATLRYGRRATGGVVNAINNRVPTELPEKPFVAELDGAYGTNADSRPGRRCADRALEAGRHPKPDHPFAVESDASLAGRR